MTMGLSTLRRYYETRDMAASPAEPDYREIAKAQQERLAALEAENAKLRAPAPVADEPESSVTESARGPETVTETPKPRRK